MHFLLVKPPIEDIIAWKFLIIIVSSNQWIKMVTICFPLPIRSQSLSIWCWCGMFNQHIQCYIQSFCHYQSTNIAKYLMASSLRAFTFTCHQTNEKFLIGDRDWWGNNKPSNMWRMHTWQTSCIKFPF
jgi:hypothetical protein